MNKIMVHIKPKEDYMDSRVSCFVTLPYIPRVGDFIFLSDKTRDKLENDIRLLRNKDNYSEWIYVKGEISVEDAIRVDSVLVIEGEKYIHIEIDK